MFAVRWMGLAPVRGECDMRIRVIIVQPTAGGGRGVTELKGAVAGRRGMEGH